MANFPTTRQPLLQASAAPYGLNANGSLFAKPDSSLTNAYAAAGLALSMVATPTDVILIQGSATFTVRIKKIILQGVATAAGNMPIQLIRRSTPYTTSGSAVLTAVLGASNNGKLDSGDPVATAVIDTIGTANFTSVGTAVATLGAGRLQLSASGSGVAITPLTFDRTDNAIALRGTSDYLAINMNGAAIPAGGVLDYYIEWEEDNS
jgi:hypothetical protein